MVGECEVSKVFYFDIAKLVVIRLFSPFFCILTKVTKFVGKKKIVKSRIILENLTEKNILESFLCPPRPKKSTRN